MIEKETKSEHITKKCPYVALRIRMKPGTEAGVQLCEFKASLVCIVFQSSLGCIVRLKTKASF